MTRLAVLLVTDRQGVLACGPGRQGLARPGGRGVGGIELMAGGTGHLNQVRILALVGRLLFGLIREHASQGGFPANRVSEIKTMIDPTTAEA